MINKSDEALSPEASSEAAAIIKEAAEKPARKPRRTKASAPAAETSDVSVKDEETKEPAANKAPRKPRKSSPKTQTASSETSAKPEAVLENVSPVSQPQPASADPVSEAEVPAQVSIAPQSDDTSREGAKSPEAAPSASSSQSMRRPRRSTAVKKEEAPADAQPVPREVTEAPKSEQPVEEPRVREASEVRPVSERPEKSENAPVKEGSQKGKQQKQQPQQSQSNQSQNGHSGRRQKRRGGNTNEPVVPQVSKEDLAALKVAELREKAKELDIDVKEFPKKEDLVEAVYTGTLKAEGFVTVSGVLDILSEGYGFLRTHGYLPGENDAYVGMNTIRRNGLRRGDLVVGQLRPPRDNEKYSALHRIDTVNGLPLAECRNRVKFSDLTPIYPDERLIMEHGKDTITARVIDLVAPIGKGQRGLIVSPPKAGKTTILKDIAASISANNPAVHLMCLLVDERPEEVTDMERSIKGEVISSTFDMPCENHIAVSELVIERAKRLVENGADVVILLDSITRLARAYNLAQPASGRILSGGVDSTALYPPKRFLGAARNIENGGSLTILASALVDTGSKMDEVIFEEFKGTGNMELKLDRSLADRRIFPAIDPVASGTRKEELLLDAQEAPFVWGVRRILSNMNNTERSMEMLIKSLKQTENNREFLVRTAKKAQSKNANSIEI